MTLPSKIRKVRASRLRDNNANWMRLFDFMDYDADVKGIISAWDL